MLSSFSRTAIGAGLATLCVATMVEPANAALRTFEFTGAGPVVTNSNNSVDLNTVFDDNFTLSLLITLDDDIAPFSFSQSGGEVEANYAFESVTLTLGGQTFPISNDTSENFIYVNDFGVGAIGELDTFQINISQEIILASSVGPLVIDNSFTFFAEDSARSALSGISLSDALDSLNGFGEQLFTFNVGNDAGLFLGSVRFPETGFEEITVVPAPTPLPLIVAGLIGITVVSRRYVYRSV